MKTDRVRCASCKGRGFHPGYKAGEQEVFERSCGNCFGQGTVKLKEAQRDDAPASP